MGNKLLIDLGNYIKNQLTEEKADNFHEQYCALIEKSDTSDVWRQFVIWILVGEEYGVIRFADSSGGSERRSGSEPRRTIQHVADLYIQKCEDVERWHAANTNAYIEAANSFRDTPAAKASNAAWAAANYMWCEYEPGYNDYAPISVVINAAKCYALTHPAYGGVHYGRMANKLIELLQAAPEKIMVGTIDDASMCNADPVMAHQILIRIGRHIEKKLGEEKTKDFMAKYYYLLHKQDTSDIWRQFVIWLLVDEKHGMIRFTKPDSEEHRAIQRVAQLYIEDCKDSLRWRDAFVSAETAIGCGFFGQGVSNNDREATATATRVAFNAVAVWYDPFSAIEAVSNAAYVFFLSSRALGAHYERMANKLIELLQNMPMIHETQSTHCKRIANKLGDLINEQESMVDNMDNSDKIIFSISHHNGTKHIMRGKETIEKQVRRIEYALSVVKALLKDNPSDAIDINVGMVDGTISITYPSK